MEQNPEVGKGSVEQRIALARGSLPRAAPAGLDGFSQPTVYRVRGGRFGSSRGRQWRRGRWLVVIALTVVVMAFGSVVGAALLVRSSFSGAPGALARVSLAFGGGSITRVALYHGPHEASVPLERKGSRIQPAVPLAAGESVLLEAVVRRPSWLSWLTGSRETVRERIRLPSARLVGQFLTVAGQQPLQVAFSRPISVLRYGPSPGSLRTVVFAQPRATVELPRSGSAGSLLVVGLPYSWERAPLETVSWFPPGSGSQAVVSPAPGGELRPATPITITFDQPLTKALGGSLPALSPHVEGSWQRLSEHVLRFQPTGYGYGLGTTVTLGLPGGVRLAGSTAGGNGASWTLPSPSTLRLQQLLAEVGTLPLAFHAQRTVADTPIAQEEAALAPPPGSFSWRYPNIPTQLSSLWSPGSFTVLTKGALMAFEDQREIYTEERYEETTPDPGVWRALIEADLAHWRASGGYSFVSVSKSQQQLTLWHDGSTILTTPVNTGIAAAPTEAGVFTVYEHLRSTTMSGTAPGGVHYEDPGVPWVSYFNGGDALHGFERAVYGVPQSLGCVEMPPATAEKVWPYTPVGTLVAINE